MSKTIKSIRPPRSASKFLMTVEIALPEPAVFLEPFGMPAAREAVGTNLAELKADIAKTIEHLDGVTAAAFEGAEQRDCSIDRSDQGFVISMDGLGFLRAWAPHFYFHLVTAYDILRHNGVVIGKRDYANWIADFVQPR
jgi:hypothetical protein